MIASKGESCAKQLQNARSFFDQAEKALERRDLAGALSLYDLAEASGFDPDDCAAGRWTCEMLLGRFERAWQESEAIERRGKPDANRFWNGRSPDGQRILIRCLHGLGDTIQFIRYVPLLRGRAASVTIEAQPSLKQLIEESELADQVITWGEREPEWDQQIEVIELPRIFRTTVETIPDHVPYLKVRGATHHDRYRSAEYDRGAGLPAPYRIGVVWASSSFNPARSIPLDLFSRLCHTPGVSFFSIQGGPERAELAGCSATIIDSEEAATSVMGAARKLLEMDLLITVDTMLAHLGGGLGIPVWTLLPHECDWRWMLQRRDSPWYPTMRLFRQDRPGDWEQVIDDVQRELGALASPAFT